MVDLSVNLAGMQMDNPIVPASGTFGYGQEYNDFYDINILGSFSFKGTQRMLVSAIPHHVLQNVLQV